MRLFLLSTVDPTVVIPKTKKETVDQAPRADSSYEIILASYCPPGSRHSKNKKKLLRKPKKAADNAAYELILASYCPPDNRYSKKTVKQAKKGRRNAAASLIHTLLHLSLT